MNPKRMFVLSLVLLALASAACMCTGGTDLAELIEELDSNPDIAVTVEAGFYHSPKSRGWVTSSTAREG